MANKFHLCETLEQAKLIYNDGKHICGCLGLSYGEGFTTKGLRKLLGAMEMVYILIMVLFTGVCSFVRTIYLKWVYYKKKINKFEKSQIELEEQKGMLSHPMLRAEPNRKKTPFPARTQPMRSQGLFVCSCPPSSPCKKPISSHAVGGICSWLTMVVSQGLQFWYDPEETHLCWISN